MAGSRRRGFTLLEAFIALGLLAFTWTAAVSLFPMSARSLSNAHRHLMADRLCRAGLEETLAHGKEHGFDSIAAAGPNTRALTFSTRGVPENVVFTWYINVLTVKPNRLKDIECVVEWHDHGVQRTSLKTRVANL